MCPAFMISYILLLISFLGRECKQKVELKYQARSRHIGTFDSRAAALLANKAARDLLMSTKNASLTDEKVQQNIGRAKQCAMEAAAGLEEGVTAEELLVQEADTWVECDRCNKVRYYSSFLSALCYSTNSSQKPFSLPVATYLGGC